MLFSCGSNSDGQLSHGPLNTSDSAHFVRTSPALPGTPVALAFGARHTLLLAAPPSTSASSLPNELHVCGSNYEGQLGPVLSAGGRDELMTELRGLRLCELGVVEVAEAGWEPALVAACAETSLVVCRWSGGGAGRDDVVVVMGADDWGERGGAGSPADGPRAITFASFAPPASAGAAFLHVSKLTAGPRHVVAVLEWVDRVTGLPTRWRKLVGWGAARQGQLGAGLADGKGKGLAKVGAPVELCTAEGRLLRDGCDVVDVALGMEHSAILLASATQPPSDPRLPPAPPPLALLGSTRKGQLGPNTMSSFNRLSLPLLSAHTAFPVQPARHQIGACWSATFVLSVSASTPAVVLSAFGSNHHSQLGLPSAALLSSAAPLPIDLSPPPPGSTREVRHLAAGSEHALLVCRLSTIRDGAVVEEDEVWAWGWNEHGNLGTGTLEDGQTPQRVWPAPGQPAGQVTGVWAGNATSWIATA